MKEIMPVRLQDKYSQWQIRLHWLTLLLLIIVYATIEVRGLTPRGSWQGKVLTTTHYSSGMLVFVTMSIRLWLRSVFPAPPVSPPLTLAWQCISSLAHKLLYLLFLALPLPGIASRYLHGQEWLLFGLPMPVSLSPDPALSRQFIDWHKTLANLGYWLTGLHVIAALAHHYLFRDNTLLRMIPGRGKSSLR